MDKCGHVVDNYFEIVERIDTQIETMEETVFSGSPGLSIETIQRLKKDLIILKRSITPLREAVGYLMRSESGLIDSRTTRYIGDVSDHIVQILDSTDTRRDILTGLMDAFISSLSNRMNQIMKVLTIIATIFIPLTFIAGIYGMNFQYMPELGWKWAYPAIWGVMVIIFLGMLIFFRRNRWI